jgi:hypothetical protein
MRMPSNGSRPQYYEEYIQYLVCVLESEAAKRTPASAQLESNSDRVLCQSKRS